MDTELSSFKKYYKALFTMFGNSQCSGCEMLAYIVDNYNTKTKLQDIYKMYAEENGITPAAVERNVRTYFQAVLQDYTLDDVQEKLGYKFKPGKNTIVTAEFVPVFKFIVDNPNINATE